MTGSQITTGQDVQIGAFLVQPQEQVTDCECPDSLCRHADGVRYFQVWIVWDTVNDDYAYIMHPQAGFADVYERKRDAVAAVKVHVHRATADFVTGLRAGRP